MKKRKNYFCSLWKSNGISFIRAIKLFKNNFKVFDNIIPDKHVKSFIKYEYKPKKFPSQIANMVVYDIDSNNTIKYVSFSSCIYRLKKRPGNYNRDISKKEYEKFRTNCFVFKRTGSIIEMLDYVLHIKR